MKIASREIKKEIVSELNIKPSVLSVRGDFNSVHIKVKEALPISLIEKIALKYRKVDRCEISQEILLGANNFYVFVDYDFNLKVDEEIVKKIEAAALNLVLNNDLTFSQRKDFLAYHIARNNIINSDWNEQDIKYLISNISSDVINKFINNK